MSGCPTCDAKREKKQNCTTCKPGEHLIRNRLVRQLIDAKKDVAYLEDQHQQAVHTGIFWFEECRRYRVECERLKSALKALGHAVEPSSKFES